MEINAAMIEEIRSMASFHDMELFVRVGRKISKTIDCFTFGGIVKMINNDLNQLIADYDRIRVMENSGLFVCE